MEPIQIILPVIVGIVCAVVFFFVGVTYRKKVAEKEIGSAEEEATRILSCPAVTALVDMKMGEEEATAWGCDLSYDYVKINGSYRN